MFQTRLLIGAVLGIGCIIRGGLYYFRHETKRLPEMKPKTIEKCKQDEKKKQMQGNKLNLIEELLSLYPEYSWNMWELSQNPNLTIQIVLNHLNHLQWNWFKVSKHANVTTWQTVVNHPNLPWDWQGISQNRNITNDIVENNLNYPWELNYRLIENPNIDIKNLHKIMCVYRKYRKYESKGFFEVFNFNGAKMQEIDSLEEIVETLWLGWKFERLDDSQVHVQQELEEMMMELGLLHDIDNCHGLL